MSREWFFRQCIAGACLALVPMITLAAPAARVEFVIGSVSATTASGQTRLLSKGDEVVSGETVTTRDGRAQLRFSDGAYVSLQPQTVYRIDEYRFDGKADGNERGFFSLLKGGLRTITGLVGRTNKRNYQVNTTVATIGIRGTEFSLLYNGGLTGTVGEGEIQVCNSGGCLPVASGGSFFVNNNQVRPELSSKKTDLPPNPPTNTGTLPSYVAGDVTSQTGEPAGFLLTGAQTVSYSATSSLFAPQDRVTAVFDSSGAATQVGNITFANGLDEFGNAFFMAWGRGMSTSQQYTHYIAGIPTLLSDLDQLATARTVATYTIAAGTTPTADLFSSAPFAVGTVTGGQLKADFSTGQVDAAILVRMPGFVASTTSPSIGITSPATTATLTPQNVDLTIKSIMHLNGSPGTPFTSSTFGQPQTAGNGVCSASVGSCSFVGMSGFFSGTGASKAGVAYQVIASQVLPQSCFSSPCDVAGGNVKGAVVFAKQ